MMNRLERGLIAEKYSRDDFSADAIESRFTCGSWDERDTRYIVALLRRLEAQKVAKSRGGELER